MQFLSFKYLFNVLILIYVITDFPRVLSRGRRGRIPRKDNSIRDDDDNDNNDIRQFPTNSLEEDDYGNHDVNKLNNFSTLDKVRRFSNVIN